MGGRARRVVFALALVALTSAVAGVYALYDRFRARCASRHTISCLALSADGQRIATGDVMGRIATWETASGALLASFERDLATAPPTGAPGASESERRVQALAFLPDGKRLAALFSVGSGFDPSTEIANENVGLARYRWTHAVVLFDEKGHELRHFEASEYDADALAVTPDGASVLVGRRLSVNVNVKGDPVRLLDLETGADRWAAGEGSDRRRVTALAIAPAGSLALAALGETGRRKTLRAIALATGETAFELDRNLETPINALAFAPDGRSFATACGGPIESEQTRYAGDYKLTESVWDWKAKTGSLALRSIGDGAELKRLEGHPAPVVAVAFSPDGKRLLSGAEDGEAILWDAASGAAIRRFRTAAFAITAVAILPGTPGRALVAGQGQDMDSHERGILALVDPESGEVVRYFEDGR